MCPDFYKLNITLQPRNDMLPCLDIIKEYLGLIFTFPDMVQVYRGAASKVHDCEKMKEEGRIDVSQCFSGRMMDNCFCWTYILPTVYIPFSHS